MFGWIAEKATNIKRGILGKSKSELLEDKEAQLKQLAALLSAGNLQETLDGVTTSLVEIGSTKSGLNAMTQTWDITIDGEKARQIVKGIQQIYDIASVTVEENAENREIRKAEQDKAQEILNNLLIYGLVERSKTKIKYNGAEVPLWYAITSTWTPDEQVKYIATMYSKFSKEEKSFLLGEEFDAEVLAKFCNSIAAGEVNEERIPNAGEIADDFRSFAIESDAMYKFIKVGNEKSAQALEALADTASLLMQFTTGIINKLNIETDQDVVRNLLNQGIQAAVWPTLFLKYLPQNLNTKTAISDVPFLHEITQRYVEACKRTVEQVAEYEAKIEDEEEGIMRGIAGQQFSVTKELHASTLGELATLQAFMQNPEIINKLLEVSVVIQNQKPQNQEALAQMQGTWSNLLSLGNIFFDDAHDLLVTLVKKGIKLDLSKIRDEHGVVFSEQVAAKLLGKKVINDIINLENPEDFSTIIKIYEQRLAPEKYNQFLNSIRKQLMYDLKNPLNVQKLGYILGDCIKVGLFSQPDGISFTESDSLLIALLKHSKLTQEEIVEKYSKINLSEKNVQELFQKSNISKVLEIPDIRQFDAIIKIRQATLGKDKFREFVQNLFADLVKDKSKSSTQGNIEKIGYLIANKLIDVKELQYEVTPISLSLMYKYGGDLQVLKALLRKYPEAVNDKDEQGNTLLHLSLVKGDAELIMSLLRAKELNPNLSNNDGLTPLGALSGARGENAFKLAQNIVNHKNLNLLEDGYKSLIMAYLGDNGKMVEFLTSRLSQAANQDKAQVMSTALEAILSQKEGVKENAKVITAKTLQFYKGTPYYSQVLLLLVKHGFIAEALELLPEGQKTLDGIWDANGLNVLSYALLQPPMIAPDAGKVDAIQTLIKRLGSVQFQNLPTGFPQHQYLSRNQQSDTPLVLGYLSYVKDTDPASKIARRQLLISAINQSGIDPSPKNKALVAEVCASADKEIFDAISKLKNFNDLINTNDLPDHSIIPPVVACFDRMFDDQGYVTDKVNYKMRSEIIAALLQNEALQVNVRDKVGLTLATDVYTKYRLAKESHRLDESQSLQEIFTRLTSHANFDINYTNSTQNNQHTLFELICINGNLEDMKALLANEKILKTINPEVVQRGISHALQAKDVAKREDYVNIVKLIHDKLGKKMDLGLVDQNGIALAHQFYSSQLEFVNLLSDWKYDVQSVQSPKNRTLLMAAASSTDIMVLRKALGEFSKKINDRDDSGNTALHYAVMTHVTGHSTDFTRELTESNANINAANNEGLTPFMIAVMSNDVQLATYLLTRQNLDVNAQDKHGNTALMYACQMGNHNMIKLLLQHEKTNVHLYNKDGLTAFMITALAKKEEEKDVVDKAVLLQSHQIEVRDKDAKHKGDEYVMRALIERGADPLFGRACHSLTDIVKMAGIGVLLYYIITIPLELLSRTGARVLSFFGAIALANKVGNATGNWVEDKLNQGATSLLQMVGLPDHRINLDGLCMIGSYHSTMAGLYYGKDLKAELGKDTGLYKEEDINKAIWTKEDLQARVSKLDLKQKKYLYEHMLQKYEYNAKVLRESWILPHVKSAMTKVQQELAESCDIVFGQQLISSQLYAPGKAYDTLATLSKTFENPWDKDRLINQIIKAEEAGKIGHASEMQQYYINLGVQIKVINDGLQSNEIIMPLEMRQRFQNFQERREMLQKRGDITFYFHKIGSFLSSFVRSSGKQMPVEIPKLEEQATNLKTESRSIQREIAVPLVNVKDVEQQTSARVQLLEKIQNGVEKTTGAIGWITGKATAVLGAAAINTDVRWGLGLATQAVTAVVGFFGLTTALCVGSVAIAGYAFKDQIVGVGGKAISVLKMGAQGLYDLCCNTPEEKKVQDLTLPEFLESFTKQQKEVKLGGVDLGLLGQSAQKTAELLNNIPQQQLAF
ncbi:hypothetical protein MIDIC_20017 [Alphaproteobacteria bacterium]